MSSSPPTDAPAAVPARWRNPAGWPLRTRLVAIMIVLLAVLGLAGRRAPPRSTCASSSTASSTPSSTTRSVQPVRPGGRQPAPATTARRRQRQPGSQLRPTSHPYDRLASAELDLVCPSTAGTRSWSSGGQRHRRRRVTRPTSTVSAGYADARPTRGVTTSSPRCTDGTRADVDLGGARRLPRRRSTTDPDGRPAWSSRCRWTTPRTRCCAVALVTGGRGAASRSVVAGWAGALIVRRTLQAAGPGRRHRDPGLRAAAGPR